MHKFRWGFAGLLAVLLSACGSGGGDGGGSSSPSSRSSSESSVSVSSSSDSSIVSSESSSSSSSSESSQLSSASSESSQSSSASSESSDSSVASSESSVSVSSSSVSSVPTEVTISGTATYDYVPIGNPGGLDYDLTEARPVRGALVELLDDSDTLLDSGQTDANGNYSLTAPVDTRVRVRVLARSRATGAQVWDIRVEDNTAGNALYAMTGSLADSGRADSVRDLHADSGWGGGSYTEPRVAGPFAILDTVYKTLQSVRAVDSVFVLPTSYFRWSPDNRPADGLLAEGDIGTSFYDSGANALYILGQEDVDTDEYDRHVIAHEWGHYLEDELVGRMDSIGGNHSSFDKLDMRVAWSEGFANAFSGIALEDPLYLDSFSTDQGLVGGGNIASTNVTNKGWYNEASVQSVLYNFAVGEGFSKIYNVLVADAFAEADSLHSIFTFAAKLDDLHPVSAMDFRSRLNQQDINGTDEFGAEETNHGGNAAHLPVYKELPADGSVVNVCSSQENGSYNKLGVSQFFRVSVNAATSYVFTAQKSDGQGQVTDPDMQLYYRGARLESFESIVDDREEGTEFLEPDREYILEVYDYFHADGSASPEQPSCFELTLAPAV